MSGDASDDGKVTVTVRIAGEEHSIRSAADPEYTRACARLVDERIQEIRERSGLLEGHRAAILAALSITDHYLRTRDELDRMRREVTSRSTNLVRRIETELGDEEADPGAGGEGGASAGERRPPGGAPDPSPPDGPTPPPSGD